MSEPLPPYSGDSPTCPKCGYDGATTKYRELGRCVHGELDVIYGVESNPRLHRECLRCDYEWDEATVTVPDGFQVRDDALKRELENLWNDLGTEVRMAHRGCWSVGCESKAERIERISRIVGPLRPGAIPMTLLADGLYERLHDQWGIDLPTDFRATLAAWRKGATQDQPGR